MTRDTVWIALLLAPAIAAAEGTASPAAGTEHEGRPEPRAEAKGAPSDSSAAVTPPTAGRR